MELSSGLYYKSIQPPHYYKQSAQHADAMGTRKTKEKSTRVIYDCASIQDSQSLKQRPLKMSSSDGVTLLLCHHAAAASKTAANMFP